MIRRLLRTTFTIAMLGLVPVSVGAMAMYTAEMTASLQDQGITITYSDGYLNIVGAEGETVEVVSLTGKKVLQEKIESPAQKVELNTPKGCYIVKVGDVVRKIFVNNR